MNTRARTVADIDRELSRAVDLRTVARGNTQRNIDVILELSATIRRLVDERLDATKETP